MRNILLFFLCLIFVSCFKEPKKEIKADDYFTNSLTKNTNKVNNTSKIIKEDSIVTEQMPIKTTVEDNFENTINEINNLIQNKGLAQIATFSVIDKPKKIILYGSYKLYLDNVYVFYLNKDYNDGYGENYISIECYNNNTCIEDVSNLSKIIAVSQPFKTKNDCQHFIELINVLKNELE